LDLLKKLAADKEPAVAAAAIASLWAAGRQHALPFAAPNIASADANLRRLAAELLCEEGNVDSIAKLGVMLDDRNPSIRRFVAARFVRFANTEDAALRKAVLEQSTAMLGGESWRGLEQAALVLGSLDHEPSAERLVALLPNDRGEVRVASGWALRRLKVAATYPAILAHAVEVEKTIAKEDSGSATTKQLSQIFQLFGEVRYTDAERLMRKFVPKSPLDQRVRGAAVWALGYLYLDNPKSDLPKLFAERLADNASPMPEVDYVRQMSGIGLGRMRAESELGTLRRFVQIDGPNTKVGRGCGWSLERLTGEKMPPGTDRQDGVLGWFLESLQSWNADQ
jgi:HEAT repeat protein